MSSDRENKTSSTALLASLGNMRCVDLTHRMKPGMPTWPTHPAFTHSLLESYETGDVSCHYGLACGEHTGTHVDAPRHFVAAAAGGWSIDAAPVDQFFSRIVIIDGTDIGPRGVLDADRIRSWEKTHGAITAGDAVFFHFGWDHFWNRPETYAAVLADWPGLSRDASTLLVSRGVHLAGSDCLSLDPFGSTEFPAHRVLLGNGVMIGENFARLGELPAICVGAVMPLPIADGSGSPVRAVAYVASA